MSFIIKLFVSSCLLVIITSATHPIKGAIGFPEVEENPMFVNKENRTPVFLPAMCRENELYYPGDQKDDWICDCRPGYLYDPKTDKCWPAFRMGPCEPGHYLVLPSGSILPTCYINPCMTDNIVMWNGRCEELGSTVPCGGSTFPTSVLWVNVTSNLLDCVSINKVEHIPGISRTPPTKCPAGSKRIIQTQCDPVPT